MIGGNISVRVLDIHEGIIRLEVEHPNTLKVQCKDIYDIRVAEDDPTSFKSKRLAEELVEEDEDS